MDRVRNFLNKNQWIAVFLFALPFLNESFPTSYFVYVWIKEDILKLFSFLILLFLFIRRKKKFSFLFGILIVLEGMLVVSSLINYRSFGSYEYEKMFFDVICILMMALIVEYFIDIPDQLIKGLLLNFEIAVYSYFIDIVFHLSGEGYYRRGLLATLLLWILPGICTALLNICINRKYIRSFCFIVISIYVVYYVMNATTVVALAAMFGAMIFGIVLYRFNRKLPFSVLLIAAVLLNLFVLFVYSGDNFPFVSFIIEKILKKSTTFTDRDVIWKEAMRMIREKPIFGHGSRPVLDVANQWADQYPHSHNQLLQKLNESGIFGLAIFSAFHLQLIRKADGSENNIVRIILISAVFGISMTYITEAYKKFFVFYLVFFLLYRCEDLLKDRYL
ncbi:MAG: O-antigen ligase family protein [Erysipelotrichaceae bacterium]|nr:O-antigen ligase family protein [Erysipelotrichaceae bacterium]